MLKIIYLNGRKGRIQAEIALQTGADKEADIVVIGEALEDQQRRPNHRTFDLASSMEQQVVIQGKIRT